MSAVELNQMIHVSDLSLGEAVTVLNDPNEVVVNVHLEKIKEEKPEEGEVEEGAEDAAPAESKDDAGKKEDG